MSRIYICGLQEMPGHVERLRPARLISLLPAADQPPTPGQVAPPDHLRVGIDDIDEPQAGLVAPAHHHIEGLIDFLRDSKPKASILIHCLAGVSRSPAAAFIAMALESPGLEFEVAQTLRSAAPFVVPNRLMVEMADDVLERRGRLVAALESMGPADWSHDFALFAVPRSVAS